MPPVAPPRPTPRAVRSPPMICRRARCTWPSATSASNRASPRRWATGGGSDAPAPGRRPGAGSAHGLTGPGPTPQAAAKPVGNGLAIHGEDTDMAGGTLHYEDVNEGDEAPATSHTLTRTDLVRYAGASGDYNPMHHDEIAATAAGQPSVFGHGMFSMGLLGSALTDYVGAGNVRHYQVRFSRQTWPGEELTTKIVVTGKRV